MSGTHSSSSGSSSGSSSLSSSSSGIITPAPTPYVRNPFVPVTPTIERYWYAVFVCVLVVAILLIIVVIACIPRYFASEPRPRKGGKRHRHGGSSSSTTNSSSSVSDSTSTSGRGYGGGTPSSAAAYLRATPYSNSPGSVPSYSGSGTYLGSSGGTSSSPRQMSPRTLPGQGRPSPNSGVYYNNNPFNSY